VANCVLSVLNKENDDDDDDDEQLKKISGD